MNRLITVLLALLLLLAFSSCAVQTRQALVLESLGEYETEQLWTHGGFQDYTDFGIYTYSAPGLSGNRYFSPVSAADLAMIDGFLDDFEGWVETFRESNPEDALAANYTFDRAVIDSEDYFYVCEKENYLPFGNYDLWFFDAQTNVLYYFHNNI